ncbi:hypothetical protein BH23GEM11_BH23GEM11_15700 [soil metagenome]
MSEKGDRPIPVRSVAPPPAPIPASSSPPGAGAAGAGAERAEIDPSPLEPPRFLELDGLRWEVQAVGQTRTGYGRDAGAILLLLKFVPVPPDAPVVGKDATPVDPREALAVARSLDDLDNEMLSELLERSRPLRQEGPGATGA